MQSRVDSDLVITAVRTDSDLDDMIAVRARADPDRPPPRRENLRNNLAGNPELTYLVARRRSEPIGCGFVEIVDASYAQGHLVVVPNERRRGVGSLLLAAVSERAGARDKTALEGEIRESDGDARAYFERRGYEVVGGEKGVALTLSEAGSPPAPPALPIPTIASPAATRPESPVRAVVSPEAPSSRSTAMSCPRS